MQNESRPLVVCPLGLAGFLLFAAGRTGDLFGAVTLIRTGTSAAAPRLSKRLGICSGRRG